MVYCFQREANINRQIYNNSEKNKAVNEKNTKKSDRSRFFWIAMGVVFTS